jgi:autotransporter passenger strand-loop-strand repeat protein
LYFTPSNAGPYYIEAAAYNNAGAGAYTVHVTEDDYDNSPQFPRSIYPPADAVPGTIEVAGDRDWFQTNLIEGTTYEFDATGRPGNGGTLSTAYLSLDTVFFLPFFRSMVVTETFGKSKMFFTPSFLGTYYVVVGGDGDGQLNTGAYNLRLTTIPTLDLGTSIQGNIATLSQHNFYAVTLTGGVTYVIRESGQDGDGGTLIDPFLTLDDGTGAGIVSNDDGGLGLDSILIYTAPVTGTYLIDAGERTNARTGTYTINVDLQPDLTAAKASFNGTTLSFEIGNQGPGGSPASNTGIYLSTDTSFSVFNDIELDTVAAPALASGSAAQQVYNVVFPTDLTPGRYYIGLLADDDGQFTNSSSVADSNRTNNESNAIPVILGNDVANALTGTSADDFMYGFGGNDALDGGDGVNTAVYGGLRKDYHASGNPDGSLTLVDQRAGSPDGTDTLANIQFVRFADGKFAIGELHDGYISGATVFADANGNGQLDAGEIWTTTSGKGSFLLTGGSGPLIAFGGTDISTGLPFSAHFSAPAGSAIVSPLTTLLTLLGDPPKLLGSLGLPADIDLTTLDPVAATRAGDANGAAVYVSGAKVVDTVVALGKGVVSLGGDAFVAQQDAFAAIAAAVGNLGSNQTLDLANAANIAGLFTTVAQSQGVSGGQFVTAVAGGIAAGNAALDQQLQSGASGDALIAGVSAVEKVAQGNSFIGNGFVVDVSADTSLSHVDIGNGGRELVFGTAIDTNVYSGGDQDVYAGGLSRATAVNAGGTQNVSGTSVDATLSGGYDNSGATVGAYQYVRSGGTTIATRVNNVAAEWVYSGGVASSTTVNSGGTLLVQDGGSASGATIGGGSGPCWEFIYGGGTAVNTTLDNFGFEEINAGGTASGTVVNSGGDELAFAGGTAGGTTGRVRWHGGRRNRQ